LSKVIFVNTNKSTTTLYFCPRGASRPGPEDHGL